jgi:hypothetical protein
MLFILAMHALGYLFTKAEIEGLLHPLSTRTLQHRVSFCADNVILFLRLVMNDTSITMDILKVFREASELQSNVPKSSIFPIRCDEEDINRLQ